MPDTEFCPAKINLNLHILGRRADGYHGLFSLVGFADYGDQLSFSPGGDEDMLTLQGRFGGNIEGDNIILKAARLLRADVSDVPFGTFTLTKNLPVASGMGGGSANAAAALRLLRKYLPKKYSFQAWQDLALALGADVPVCLKGEAVYMSGIGENLQFAKDVPPQHAVLVNPLIGVSTAKVFKALAAPSLKEGADHASVNKLCFDRAAGETFKDYLLNTRNDLEKPALEIEPKIAHVLSILRAQPGCFLSRMSGSGATCFGLFAQEEDAAKAAKALSAMEENCWVVKTIVQ